MRVLYLDCHMGAAGDMLMAALLELLPEEQREDFIEKLNALGIPGVHAEMARSAKCGIMGTHVSVTVNGENEEDFHHYGEDHEHEHHHDHGHEHDHHDEGHDVHGHHHHGESHEHDHSHDHGGHHHSSLGDITSIINGLDVPESVKGRAAHV